MSLDINQARSFFPALKSGFVYMDNAGGSQTARPVVDRLGDYLLNTDVQLGATYEISQRAGERVAEAAREMAAFVNAADPLEIVMGPSTTMMMHILATCFSQTLTPGEEIIVTNTDHEANVDPWVKLAERGFTVKVWKCNKETLELDLEELAELLTEQTRLVAVTHASNILGTINPIRKIADMVHDAGAYLAVDGVAFAPHGAIDVQALGVDFYGFSFYKAYGPHYALLYGRREILENMPKFNLEFIDTLPYRFQPGNVNFELSYSMLGVIDYFRALQGNDPALSTRQVVEGAYGLFRDQEESLQKRLLDFLASKSKVKIIGSKSHDRNVRVPTISFVVEGMNSDEIPLVTDPHGIGIRYGDFYARRLIANQRLSRRNGVIRVSMVHYNTIEEVDRLIQVLDTCF